MEHHKFRQQKFGEAPPENVNLPTSTISSSPTQAPSGGFVGGAPAAKPNVF